MLYHIAKVCPLVEYPRTAHQMLPYLSLIRIDNQKKTKYCQAQLQLSAQLKAELALFSFNTATHPTTHPTGKVVKRKETSSISIQDF